MDKPPRLDLADHYQRLEGEMQQLRAQISRMRRQMILGSVAFAVVVMGMVGLGVGAGRLLGKGQSNMAVPGRVECGVAAVELSQQTVAIGGVTFSKPFRSRPLVFVCEAGHAGAFLTCKTDAISETGFTWAVGAGPVRRDYKSELVWLAIESDSIR